MKRLWYLFLLFLAACSSEITINTDTYNLNGKVKSITDIQSQGVYDNNWNVYPDTSMLDAGSLIQTRYFDEEGLWIKAEMKLTNGSLHSTVEVLYNESGQYTGTKEKNEKGELFRETVVTEISSSCIKVETRDPKGKVLSNTTSDYEDGLMMKQKTNWVDGKLEFEYTYKRDGDGNEEEIKIETSKAGQTDSGTTETMLVKILKKDIYGNWTRLAYYDTKNNKCTVVDRKIIYY